MSLSVESAVRCSNILGEGAFWDARRGLLWWLDVPIPSKLLSLDPASGAVHSYDMPEMITSMRAMKDGASLLIASHGGINRFDIASGTLTHLFRPEPTLPYNRCNDGGTDARGRFWFGTMQNNLAFDTSGIPIAAGAGTLYRLDPDMRLTAFETGITVSNTVCWSPDSKTMYFCDTATGVIWAYDYDLDDGVISNRRDFARFDRGAPDGSTVDAEGCLWNCRWDGACVVRFTPDGKVDRVIDLPVARPTSCAFGGAGHDELYITSARYGMGAAEIASAPNAGDLFVCRPGISGPPTPEFG